MFLNAKRSLGLLLIVLLALTLLPAASVQADAPAFQAEVTATPAVGLRVRSGPGTTFAPVALLNAGATLTVVGRNHQANWLLVDYAPGQQGWIAGWWCTIAGDVQSVPVVTSLAPAPAAGESTLSSTVQATAIAGMNMRAGPGTGYPVVGLLPRSVSVQVLARHAAYPIWIAVEYNGQKGFVHSGWMNVDGNLDSVPLVASLDEVGTAAGVLPTPAPPPFSGVYRAQLAYVGPHLQPIYWRGRALGNFSYRFSKIGDSETDNPLFLGALDQGWYELGDRDAYLEDTIKFFNGSFSRIGPSAHEGMFAQTLLDPFWSDPNVCVRGESRIECEYRLHHPAIALILVRTDSLDVLLTEYELSMREIVELSMRRGVIPVLSTVTWNPVNSDFPEKQNAIIRRLAAEYQVPLWDLYATTYGMPNHGIDNATAHLTITPDATHFADEALIAQYGIVRRNLEALEVLHAIYTQVMGY